MGPTKRPQALSLPRQFSIAARWPLGIGLTSWRYMWRITPLKRREIAGSPADSPVPALAPGLSSEGMQGLERGVGPLFHRRYRTRMQGARVSPEELIDRISSEPNLVAPTEFARFIKLSGDERRMAVGDELIVRMPGPWDGPVRVVDRTATSFRFVTLEGHLEAGQIEFRAYADGGLVFEIESWARSGDRLSSLLFNKLRMAKEVQLHMWTSVLERAVRLAQGRRDGSVTIETRRIDVDG
jgi:hypothetical protein